jgi:hypothetical protein
MKQTFEVVRETTGIDIENASRRVVENLGMGVGGPRPVPASEPVPDENE